METFYLKAHLLGNRYYPRTVAIGLEAIRLKTCAWYLYKWVLKRSECRKSNTEQNTKIPKLGRPNDFSAMRSTGQHHSASPTGSSLTLSFPSLHFTILMPASHPAVQDLLTDSPMSTSHCLTVTTNAVLLCMKHFSMVQFRSSDEYNLSSLPVCLECISYL